MFDGLNSDLPMPDRGRAVAWFIGIVFLILLIWGLRAAAVVAVPVVFAILITLLVVPLDNRLTSVLPHRVRWLAHVLVMALIIVVLLLFGGLLFFAAQRALEALPDISDEVDALMKASQDGESAQSERFLRHLRDVWGAAGGMFGGWLVDRATSIAQSAVTMTGAFLSALLIILFIVVHALIEHSQWGAKLASLMDDTEDSTRQATIGQIARRLRIFLLVRTLVGLLQAALYAGWLALFGIDLIVVWAVLTFLLTYIPNIGSIISGVLPVLYAFLVADLSTAIWVAAGLFTIEQVVGNFIDPRLQGREVVLSPTVILVAIMFWAWEWGIAGAFLATPITLCLLVTFNRIPALRPVSLFLSNQRSLEDLDDALDR